MDILALAIVFAFGAIIGSFLNVVIYRYNSGSSLVYGRSCCFSCGKPLGPLELIPIVSFLWSRGRCAGCGARISWQYIIVETLSGALFLAVFLLNLSVLETILVLAAFSTLLVIAVYDMRHQIIPDGLAALFAVLGLLRFVFLVGLEQIIQFPAAWTLIAGPALFLPFGILWFVSRGRWLGLGDGKLAFGIGWFLGMSAGGTAILLAFWIGAGVALFLMAVQKIAPHVWGGTKFSMQSALPFGPLLILALFIVYFTHLDFFSSSGILYLPL